MSEKNKGGRPSSYKPEYCALLITNFKAGKSYAAFASLCEVSRNTLHEWEKKHPEFQDAKNTGWEHYQAYWEQIGHDGVYNQTFKDDSGTRTVSLNAAVWIYNMKCRFKQDWYDAQKIESENKTKLEISDEVKYWADKLSALKEMK